MSKSAPAQAASMGDDGTSTAPVAARPSFEDRLGQYLTSQVGSAGGGMGAQIFGLPQQQQPQQADLVGMNAKPKEGGGMALLKLLFGG